jgi:hypothetical protein
MAEDKQEAVFNLGCRDALRFTVMGGVPPQTMSLSSCGTAAGSAAAGHACMLRSSVCTRVHSLAIVGVNTFISDQECCSD